MPENIATRPLVMNPPDGGFRIRRDVEYAPGLLADIFSPADEKRHPVIIFIHGGPVPEGAQPHRMQVFRDYGALAAASGFVGIIFSHRFFGTAIEQAAGDVASAIEFAQKQPEVDADRMFLWCFSGGGPFVTLGFDRANVRGIVAYYAVLDLIAREGSNAITPALRARLSPLERLRSGVKCPPMLVARAGKDMEVLNAAMEQFVAEALRRNVELEVMTHPDGLHGFDILNDDDRSRAIIRRTFEFIREHAG